MDSLPPSGAERTGFRTAARQAEPSVNPVVTRSVLVHQHIQHGSLSQNGR